MNKEILKFNRRQKRRARGKGGMLGTNIRPRLVVYKSLSSIYGQLIDDVNNITLISISSREKGIIKEKLTKSEISSKMGKELAKRAIKKKISKVVFDRNGFLYHGRIKAFADGAREGGLIFWQK